MLDESPPSVPTNRAALISTIAAILTLISFCTAVAPIPFTGYVCYPAAALLGLVALLTGIASLVQIRATRENGRALALIGVWTGGITLAAVVCAATLGILLFPKVTGLIQHYIK